MVSNKSQLNRKNVRIVLYEGAASAKLSAERRAALLGALLSAGYGVTCAGRGETGADAVSPADGASVLVLGEFEGGVAPQGVVKAGDIPVRFQDLKGLDDAAVLERVRAWGDEAGAYVPGKWKPWFPVIDYDRCTNCMQCLSFCLFDVYGTSGEGQIQVQNMDNCKTDCPACSRVCPEVAILFPKYSGGPINGDVVREEDLKKESMKVDISALLGGDIYSALRQRSTDAKERFSKERDEKRALQERKRCLKKLKEALDIPDEVLNSLPGADQIREKAARKMAGN